MQHRQLLTIKSHFPEPLLQPKNQKVMLTTHADLACLICVAY